MIRLKLSREKAQEKTAKDTAVFQQIDTVAQAGGRIEPRRHDEHDVRRRGRRLPTTADEDFFLLVDTFVVSVVPSW
jgi:hypothetical protein